jgi:hypothetical protein
MTAVAPPPSGTGCVECLDREDGWWFHLRRCVECGHVGCCDASIGQHASTHAAATGHAVAASFEPGEEWFWDYAERAPAPPIPLSPPRWRPEDQPAPGPEGHVPENWKSLLHRPEG